LSADGIYHVDCTSDGNRTSIAKASPLTVARPRYQTMPTAIEVSRQQTGAVLGFVAGTMIEDLQEQPVVTKRLALREC